MTALNFDQLYEIWVSTANPSSTTSRMVRSTLKHIASVSDQKDWRALSVRPLNEALVSLDAALAKQDLCTQSKCNYRTYLRRLYKETTELHHEIAGNGNGRAWPDFPETVDVPRRVNIAYRHFVVWAIGRGLSPAATRGQDLIDWALGRRQCGSKHWRTDYRRLTEAWRELAFVDLLPKPAFEPLPTLRPPAYALKLPEWPPYLREQWEAMVMEASAPLRRGGMRAWRQISREAYQGKLERYLGWFTRAHPGYDLRHETWNTLLSPDRCRAYVNWLVQQSPNDYINPGHTALLRAIRGFHRFLLGSERSVIEEFNDLLRRVEVQQRDKAARMAPHPVLVHALRDTIDAVSGSARNCPRDGAGRRKLAVRQADTIIFGLLVLRGLRSRNIRDARIHTNLRQTEDGFRLCYSGSEMKGHRAYEVNVPEPLVPVIADYLLYGYQTLTGKKPFQGDSFLVTQKGRPLMKGTFAARVRRITRRAVGRELHPHIFRHVLATHAAQVLRLTPPELAALLGHRSVQTVMRYYEVTSPDLAAGRLDDVLGS